MSDWYIPILVALVVEKTLTDLAPLRILGIIRVI